MVEKIKYMEAIKLSEMALYLCHVIYSSSNPALTILTLTEAAEIEADICREFFANYVGVPEILGDKMNLETTMEEISLSRITSSATHTRAATPFAYLGALYPYWELNVMSILTERALIQTALRWDEADVILAGIDELIAYKRKVGNN